MLTALVVATLLMTLIEKRTAYADYHFPLNQGFSVSVSRQGDSCMGSRCFSLLMVLIAAFRGFSLGTHGAFQRGCLEIRRGVMRGLHYGRVFEEFPFLAATCSRL